MRHAHAAVAVHVHDGLTGGRAQRVPAWPQAGGWTEQCHAPSAQQQRAFGSRLHLQGVMAMPRHHAAKLAPRAARVEGLHGRQPGVPIRSDLELLRRASIRNANGESRSQAPPPGPPLDGLPHLLLTSQMRGSVYCETTPMGMPTLVNMMFSAQRRTQPPQQLAGQQLAGSFHAASTWTPGRRTRHGSQQRAHLQAWAGAGCAHAPATAPNPGAPPRAQSRL